MKFKDIEFGMAAAENECAYKPDLLIDGFLDAYGYIDELIIKHKFLVLGPKGSGKSAIGYKIELDASGNEKLFVQACSLEGFPYNSFSGIIPGGEAPEIKLPNHWELLLLIAFMESFSRDSNCICSGSINIRALAKSFRDAGITPGKSILTNIVKTTTKREFKFELPKIISYARSTEREIDNSNVRQLLASLQDACLSIKTEKKHIIIVDGLDRVLTSRDRQYKSLAALIYEADMLNNKFSRNGVNAKVIVLCRTDLFDKLSGPDLNKIKRDMGITLNWFQDINDIENTNLMKLINLRAKLSLNCEEISVFKRFMPPDIWNGMPTAKALFDHTRHTPRDIIQLLNEIQKYTRRDNPTKEDIDNGIHSYSLNHFVKEIRDELAGYLESEEIDQTLKLLSKMKSARFTYQDLKQKKETDKSFENLDLLKILNHLFECGAIGNKRPGKYGKYVFIWKFRTSDYASFDESEEIMLHRGLRSALNIIR